MGLCNKGAFAGYFINVGLFANDAADVVAALEGGSEGLETNVTRYSCDLISFYK